MTKSAPDERRVDEQKPLPKVGPAKPITAKSELEVLDDLAEEDILAGRIQEFETLDEFKKFLSEDARI